MGDSNLGNTKVSTQGECTFLSRERGLGHLSDAKVRVLGFLAWCFPALCLRATGGIKTNGKSQARSVSELDGMLSLIHI